MKLILLCLFLFTGLHLNAQTVTGKLVDSKTKQSIAFVNLTFTEKGHPNNIKYASSDSLGNFEFKGVSIGAHILSGTLVGYQKLQREFSISQSMESLNLGSILMLEDVGTLQEITINGGTPNFSTQNGQMKIGVANNAFFKSSATLLDVFRKLPGLQVNQDGTMLIAGRATPTLFVDGKPVNMSSDEIQTYLSSLSPDMVESIDLITQPASKYDGEYQAIIDLKLKRNQSLGLQGNYSARFQRNNYSLLDNNLSLTYKTNRLIYDLKLGHTTGSTFYKYHALQYLANANAMITDTRTATSNQNYNVQARLAYPLQKGHSLEAFVRTFQVRRHADTRTLLLTQSNNLAQTVAQANGTNNALPKQYNYAGGLNYDAQFKNSELLVIVSLAKIDNRQNEDIENWNAIKNERLNYWKTNSRNNILIHTAQADYSQNFGLGKVELGSKFAYTTTENNLRYDTLANNVFNLDPNRSNQFGYREYISAGYLSYGAKWNKINYSLSMRAEHTHTVANSITTNLVTERNYLNWLPSLNITYTINDKEQLSLSYSKRLTRPSFAALNPFRFYYSIRHYWIGNPYLQPSTTNLLSLAYSKKAFNISLNAGRERDVITRYPEYNPETNELIFLGRNIPYRDFANLQLSSPLTINKWWRMNTNISFNYNRELTPYYNRTYSIGIFNYNINGSQVVNLKDWLLDISYSYESKSGNGLYIFKPIYSADFGLQKAWLKNKLNTKLTLFDAFDNIKRRLIFREKSIINNDMYHYFGAQRLVFSITYNFGTSTFKIKDNKKSDEENRAN